MEFPKLTGISETTGNLSYCLRNYPQFTIGRNRLSSCLIENCIISRTHCIIEQMNGEWKLKDNSSNGTKLNDLLLTKSQEHILRNGDVITLAENIKFRFQTEAPKRILGTYTDEDLLDIADAILEEVCTFNESIGPVETESTQQTSAQPAKTGDTTDSTAQPATTHGTIIQQPTGPIFIQTAACSNNIYFDHVNHPFGKAEPISWFVNTQTETTTAKKVKQPLTSEQLKTTSEQPQTTSEQPQTTMYHLKTALEQPETNMYYITTTVVQPKTTMSHVITTAEQPQATAINLQQSTSSDIQPTACVASTSAESVASTSAQPVTGTESKKNNFEDAEDELTCSICAELFIKAVTLSCSHTFCNSCITQWQKLQKVCPVCRVDTVASLPTRVIDQLVEKFLQNASEEVRSHYAQIVKERAAIEVPTASTSKASGSKSTTSSRRRAASEAIEISSESDSDTPSGSSFELPSWSEQYEDEDFSDYDEDCEDDADEGYTGIPGNYFGGYGRCFKCGQRGHWANGCPSNKRRRHD